MAGVFSLEKDSKVKSKNISETKVNGESNVFQCFQKEKPIHKYNNYAFSPHPYPIYKKIQTKNLDKKFSFVCKF